MQQTSGLMLAAILFLVQILLGALRWQLVLSVLSTPEHPGLKKLDSFIIFYIGVFFNNCLPGTVGGDVVRAWMAKSEHVPLQTAINSVIIDRMIALAALVILVLLTVPKLGTYLDINAYYVWPLVLLTLAIGWSGFIHAPRLLARHQHIPPVRWLLYFLQSLRALFSYPKVSTISLIYAFVSHLIYCLIGYVLAQSFGIDLTLLQCILFIPLVVLVSILPISIGGWGVREATMVGMLGLAGVPSTAALMISIELGLINIVASAPAAVLWIFYRRK